MSDQSTKRRVETDSVLMAPAKVVSGPGQVIPTLTAPKRYQLHTYSLVGKLNLKQAAEALYPGVTERSDQDCLICHLSAEEKIFIFKFGAVVFFNVPPGAHENYLSRLGVSSKQKPQVAAGVAADEFAEDEVYITVEPGVTQVGFNSATIPEFDITMIQLTAQLLAQSSALELTEWEVEEFLAKSESLTQFLKGKEHRRPRRAELLQFLGEGLSVRHWVVNQLGALNEPEKTWEREQLYKFYRDLYTMFDIPDRVENIEKMLRLASEVSELLLGIVHARRSEIMEITIIVLIAVEISISLSTWLFNWISG